MYVMFSFSVIIDIFSSLSNVAIVVAMDIPPIITQFNPVRPFCLPICICVDGHFCFFTQLQCVFFIQQI